MLSREERNRYHSAYQYARYHERMDYAKRHLGGKCVKCGVSEGLQIDHIKPSTKTNDVSKLTKLSMAKFLEELAKCQLLCKPCHDAKSNVEIQVEHGGGLSGKKNCKCSPCKERKAEYMKLYMRRPRS